MSEAQIVKSFGLDAGYVYATENWKYAPSIGSSGDWIKPISTFTGGVFAETFELEKFSLMAKLQYVGKGRTMHVMVTRADPNPQGYVDMGYQDIHERLDYLCVPILLKYKISLSTIEPFLAAGPRFEYLVGHPSSVVFDQFKKSEWAMTFSAGTDISISSLPKFFLEAEYNTSLMDSYQGQFVTVNDHSLEFLVGVYW
jgi:hypothetical protein